MICFLFTFFLKKIIDTSYQKESELHARLARKMEKRTELDKWSYLHDKAQRVGKTCHINIEHGGQVLIHRIVLVSTAAGASPRNCGLLASPLLIHSPFGVLLLS